VEFSDINTSVPRAPTIGICVHYPKILSPLTLSRYSAVYNFHPSLLPWGRGAFAAFWSIWAAEPAGATLHIMEAKLDAGPIVDQIQVAVLPTDTCASLHARVAAAEQLLFQRNWPRIVAGETLPASPQPPGGSYHTVAEHTRVASSNAVDLQVGDLLRLIRALTFGPASGLRVNIGESTMMLRFAAIEDADTAGS
jgi:methionyl-tRNA formyltransferase